MKIPNPVNIIESAWFEKLLIWILLGILVFCILLFAGLLIQGIIWAVSPTDCQIINGLEYCR